MRTHKILYVEIIPVLALLAVSTALAEGRIPCMLVPDAAETAQMHLLWQTEPGLRYTLDTSTNLLSEWTPVPGYPAVADGLSFSHTFTLGAQGFFRFGVLDDQPPKIVSQYPPADDFAVGRFADLTFQLDDAAGIDPASIRLTVGEIGPLAPGAEGLVIMGNTVTYDSGAVALGAWGSTVSATLVASDTLGHTLTNTWSFRLEPEPQTAAEVFVFGSPVAQCAGQQVRGPASVLATRYPAVPAIMAAPSASAAAWSIERVDSDLVVIAYAEGDAPTFAAGMLICNLTPVTENEIFYRRVLSSSNDTVNSRITIRTEDAGLTNFVSQGAVSISDSSAILELDGGGAVVSLTSVKASSVGGTVTFPPIGHDLSGTEISLRSDGYEVTALGVTYSLGNADPWLKVSLPWYAWYFTPQIQAAIEIDDSGMKSFKAIAKGEVSFGNTISAEAVLAGLSSEYKLFDLKGRYKVVYLGQIGLIPVFVTFNLNMGLTAKAEAKVVLKVNATYQQSMIADFGLVYERATGLARVSRFENRAPPVLEGDGNLTDELSCRFTLDPRFECLVYALAGMKAAIEPSVGIVTTVPIIGGKFAAVVQAGADFVLGTVGPCFEQLGYTDDQAIKINIWKGEWPIPSHSLAFTTQPCGQTVAPGDPVSFYCTVAASSPPSLQWFHKGLAIPGQTSRSLFIPSANAGHAGNYHLRATVGNLATNSDPALLVVQATTPSNLDSDKDGIPDIHETGTGVWVSPTDRGTRPDRWDSDGDGLRDGVEDNTGVYVSPERTGTNPNLVDTDGDGVDDKREVELGINPTDSTPEMLLIPAGRNSGLDPDFGTYSLMLAEPVYMDKFEVSMALWDEVADWAATNGYSMRMPNCDPAPQLPLCWENWYDCVKWCNARSEKEGLPVCYRVGGNVYRNGEDPAVTCDMAAPGYRLPTEVEWEYAARGGLYDKRFPWGDTLDHDKANYYGDDIFDIVPWDTGYLGPDPRWVRGASGDYRSPVGSYAPNGYGLYDMAGNVAEWCWDLHPDGRRATRDGFFPGFSLRVGSVKPTEPWNYAPGEDTGFRTVRAAVPVPYCYLTTATCGSGTLNAVSDWKPSGAHVVITATPSANNHFTAWSGDTDGCVANGNVITVSMTRPRTIIANFAINRHTLTVQTPYGSSTLGGETTYDYGALVAVSVSGSPANAGTTQYVNTGWAMIGGEPASGSGSSVTLTLTNNATLTWLWSPGFYYLATATDGNGTVTPTSQWVQIGSNVVLTAFANNNQQFASWSGTVPAAQTNDNPLTLAMTQPHTVTANFTAGSTVPVGMGLLAAGTNSGTDPDIGAYSLTLAAPLYMDTFEITKAQWDEVSVWALAHGYGFETAGTGKAADHPVVAVNWYNCVKWCNARSEKEGLAPAYYTDAAKSTVYKTGQNNLTDDCVNWGSGYRLPTGIEWEYAARGGLSGKRFPWGDTIDHDQANYYGQPDGVYDLGYAGHDTRYNTLSKPYTSPVGSFAANGYGLYDMAGNAWEWCWDGSGSGRAMRGGCWDKAGFHARCGRVQVYSPYFSDNLYGFRCVKAAQ